MLLRRQRAAHPDLHVLRDGLADGLQLDAAQQEPIVDGAQDGWIENWRDQWPFDRGVHLPELGLSHTSFEVVVPAIPVGDLQLAAHGCWPLRAS